MQSASDAAEPFFSGESKGDKPMTLTAAYTPTATSADDQLVELADAVRKQVGSDCQMQMASKDEGDGKFSLTAKALMKSGEHAGYTLVFTYAPPRPRWTKGSPNPKATFETAMGSFTCEIYLEQMEYTASNFIDLAEKGFYNGLHFHRVIAEFMDQFGCPYSADPNSSRCGTGGPDGNTTFVNLVTGAVESRDPKGKIRDEHTAKISNEPGTLSMANAGPDSGGSQFFMNVVHNDFLDFFSEGESQHPVFGKAAGQADLDVMVKISEVETDEETPVTPIMMKSVTISGLS